MIKKLFLGVVLLSNLYATAQKKPLDHSVYDGWEAINERYISNNGKVVVYTVNPQEGNGTLFIQNSDGKKLVEIARGYNAKITEDNQFVICKIRPTYEQLRTARIQKKSPADTPKDSLAIVNLSTLAVEKIARVKSYKLPEKSGAVLMYLLEKAIIDPAKPATRLNLDSASRIKMMLALADSLTKAADSIKNKLQEVQTKGLASLQPARRETPTAAGRTNARSNEETVEEGTELVIVTLNNGKKTSFKLVSDYYINKLGNVSIIKTTKANGVANSKATVIQYKPVEKRIDTLLKGFNDAKGFAFDEEGNQVAFVAERDSSTKALQKFYGLYYYTFGNDTAVKIADRFTKGMPNSFSVAEFGNVQFSNSGQRLFFGTAPILPPKDTTLPEFERVSVDIWHHQDEDLQTVQLKNLEQILRRSFLARYDFEKKQIIQLANEKITRVQQTYDGDGSVFYGGSDFGRRIQRQWTGGSTNDIFAINPVTGETKLIVANFKGSTYPSTTGQFLLLFDEKKKAYSCYNNNTQKINAVATDIKYPLFDTENDVPDDANGLGIMGWLDNDSAVFVYDEFDIWKINPNTSTGSVSITKGLGRTNKLTFRNIVLDRDERAIKPNQQLVFSVFNNLTKGSGLVGHQINNSFNLNASTVTQNCRIANVFKAKDANILTISTETAEKSADIQTTALVNGNIATSNSLFQPNPQQAQYNWVKAELFKWKAYTGKETEGIVYKPENFDPKKKYPMIVYFYERNNQTLYNYQAPAPTPSRLNIPFFVSRGYVVFVPDIWYTTGKPGKSAFDYIVSGTRALIKLGYVDSAKIGLQGQSWGGYQTAHIITRTNLYAAAWAGAPVVNMFSAYGGIRWESGNNRQFQYEKGQSRIGATIWEKPDLYIENSPLFHLPKVKTPLVIMSNDADGAVPWYQGIEYFTAMRRLNKPVWMLNYNNEAHNLIERKNRKDIQIREQQFFDWLLKGEKPAKWIVEGVPAVMKGRDWGLGN